MKFFYKKVNNLSLLMCDVVSGRTKPVLVLSQGFLMYEALLACVLGGVMVCAAFGMIARMQHNAHIITRIDNVLCAVRREIVHKEYSIEPDDQAGAVGIQLHTLPSQLSPQAIASLSSAARMLSGKKTVYAPTRNVNGIIATWRDHAGDKHATGFMHVSLASKKRLSHGGGHHA